MLRIRKRVPYKTNYVELENDFVRWMVPAVMTWQSRYRHQAELLGTSMASVCECLSR